MRVRADEERVRCAKQSSFNNPTRVLGGEELGHATHSLAPHIAVRRGKGSCKYHGYVTLGLRSTHQGHVLQRFRKKVPSRNKSDICHK